MRNIKTFKLFESKSEIDIDAVCSIYEDIKSIEYILEERGIYPQMRLEVVCVPDGTLQKEIRSILIRKMEEIRGFLMRPTFKLRNFKIIVENCKNEPNMNKYDNRNKIMGDDNFKIEFQKYYGLLKEHLDYVPDYFISNKGWRPPLSYEISISSDFFGGVK